MGSSAPGLLPDVGRYYRRRYRSRTRWSAHSLCRLRLRPYREAAPCGAGAPHRLSWNVSRWCCWIAWCSSCRARWVEVVRPESSSCCESPSCPGMWSRRWCVCGRALSSALYNTFYIRFVKLGKSPSPLDESPRGSPSASSPPLRCEGALCGECLPVERAALVSMVRW